MLCADCAKYGCEFSSYSSFQKPQTQKQPSGEGNCLILNTQYRWAVCSKHFANDQFYLFANLQWTISEKPNRGIQNDPS